MPNIDLVGFVQSVWKHIVDFFPSGVVIFKGFFAFLIIASIPVSLFFVVGIVYCIEQIKHIRRKEEAIYDTKVEEAVDAVDQGDPELAHRWDAVKKHIEGSSQNDWKQAIIEADIILDQLLTKMGYQGDSIGEKLKRVVPGEMRTLQDAWEAHKVRNQIAHEGSEFVIGQHEARRVIGRYQTVFEEFYFI